MTTHLTTTLTTTELDTPVGRLRLARSDAGLAAVGFTDGWDRLAADLSRHRGTVAFAPGPAGAADAALSAYLDGDLSALDAVTVDMTGTDFQRRVWSALRAVPAGETVSYAKLAAAIGAPRAVRAVGGANGANPVCVVVPCHRVVQADGSLGGYGYGPERKAWLLDHETRHR